jgi:hypothetical protein
VASPVNEPPRRASERIRAARAYRRPSGLSATILAFSIIFVLAYVFLLRTPPPVPTPQLQALRGTYTWKAQQTSGSGQDIAAPSGSGTFSAVAGGDAGGSFRGPASAGGMTAVVVAAYDAGTRTESASASGAAGPGKHFIAVEGVWPPAWRLATRSPLDYQGLAAVVRAAVEDGDRSIGIKPLKEGERKVWRAAMTLDGEPVELVVDQLSGIVTWYADPRATFTAEVAWDSPPPEGQSFTVAPPNGATVARRTDRTYTYEVSPAAAGTAAGFAPLSSDLAPDGYALAAVATAAAPELPGAWLGDGSAADALAAPQGGQRLLAELYLRGLTWFTVEQLGPASAGAAAARLQKALTTAGSGKLSFERTPLNYGEFAGQSAATWYERSGPTLVVGDASYLVRVSGGLTRQELLSFAEGLKPLGAAPGAMSSTPGASPSP